MGEEESKRTALIGNDKLHRIDLYPQHHDAVARTQQEEGDREATKELWKLADSHPEKAQTRRPRARAYLSSKSSEA